MGRSLATITAADCDQVHKVTLAVELRTPATQCDFEPLLDPNTPATCGAGTGVKPGGYLEDFEDGLAGWDLTSPRSGVPGRHHRPVDVHHRPAGGQQAGR